jgi:predicted TIM-barrel enzyme
MRTKNSHLKLPDRNPVKESLRQGRPIIGGGAGTGISAKFEEAGGIDLIVIYNSGRFRMAGHGSLAGLMPFGDANAIVMEMANEVLPVVRKTPVLAGVCGTDPMRLMDKFLEQLQAVGFAGVQNFPTVGLIDGIFRANLEETNMGYGKEVEMIRLARQLDLLTTPYVFDPNDANDLVRAITAVLAERDTFRRNAIAASKELSWESQEPRRPTGTFT